MSKPPVPSDRTPSPRHKGRKQLVTGQPPSKTQIVKALMSLINRPGTEADAVTYLEQTITGLGGIGIGAGAGRNDRGTAILIATSVENSLKAALAQKLGIKDIHKIMIFEDEKSPLQTFSAKIRMALAIGLINDAEKGNLDLIRKIRNVFAHAPSPVKFMTPEIHDACAILAVPMPTDSADNQNIANAIGSDRFRIVCERIAVALRYRSQ